MDLPVDVEVKCSDGFCGRSTYIILNPVTDRVTHLVVQESEFPNTERLVEIDQVIHSNPEHIHLRCTNEEFLQMEPFIETDFSPSDMHYMEDESYMLWPYSIPESPSAIMKYEHIPAGELAIRRGTSIYASDGSVGKLDEFLVDPTNEQITHLILREGHIWDPKEVTIPVSEIERIETDGVYLKLNKEDIRKLPAIPLRRRVYTT